ncbi:hypothetical protein Dip510_000587 [Elusimicrobium posterum]|uniref:hypothetical protein n=1 Tax=Elusimicrobium posterum TaxID=3116653 RepID=UPI003C760442
MTREKQHKFFTFLLGAMAVVLVLLPLTIKSRADNMRARALDPKIINDMKLDVPLQAQVVTVTGDNSTQEGQRSVGYGNIGSAIVTPARYNIGTFGEKDYDTLGTAPWGLLNTVSLNEDDPEMIYYVFNNITVNNAFLARADVKDLVNDPKVLYAVIQNEEALSNFFNYNAVRTALSKPKVVEAIAGSRIMDSILRAPAAQYFLKNPKTSANLISKSPTLTELKNNPAIAAAFKKNKHTSKAAVVILK